MTRNDIKQYAIDICVPLMERNARRMKKGEYALKPDQVGFIPAMLENFCRPFWGIAPILAEGEKITLNVDGESVDVFEYMRDILRSGFDKENGWEKYKEYFGQYSYENQNITEIAGLMIGIWFARKQLWEPLEKQDKDNFAQAIYDMALVAFDHSWPNNHYWFPLFSVTVLKRLGYTFPETERMLDEGLAFLDSLYLGDGWYADGAFGRFDYYEAWSLHAYPLLWTLIADDSFTDYQKHKADYVSRTNEFLDFYTHWFDKDGAQVAFGRSLSYRFAASCIFPMAVMAGCDIDPSLAGRVLSKNIEFFKNNVKLEDDGVLPEGYLYKAPGVIEGYTSDGGAYWCCKSFLALMIEAEHPFWQIEDVKIPAEKEEFSVRPKPDNINLIFTGSNGLVTMYNNTSQYYQNKTHSAHFGNVRDWYGKFAYNSACGFGCSTPDVTSLDSMIGLETTDRGMLSHRIGFDDLGYDGEFLHSVQTPFANDEDTTIETWILPMGVSHVRIHKVKLSRPYFVKEGGFSLGRWDDYLPTEICGNTSVVKSRTMYSAMTSVSSTEIKNGIGGTQAGYHMYAPLAAYPTYETERALPAGEYIFASVFTVDQIENCGNKTPQISLCGNVITVTDVDGSCIKKEIK